MNNNQDRRVRLANLVKKKRESLNMGQDAFCKWIVEQTGIADLSYGALQAWENPERRGKLPSCDNFYALAKIFGTTMDELYRYLCDDTDSTPQIIDQAFEEEKLKTKVKSMPVLFQRELMLSIQADLIVDAA